MAKPKWTIEDHEASWQEWYIEFMEDGSLDIVSPGCFECAEHTIVIPANVVPAIYRSNK